MREPDRAGSPPAPHDRRSFLVWVINGLGAILAAVIGVPIAAYIFDPRNRPGAGGEMKLAEGVALNELTDARPVRQGVIRDVRRDAWTLNPNDVIGRVWVVLLPGQAVPSDPAARRGLASHDAQGNPRSGLPIKVFTTICPHLGCSVNLDADGQSFLCPCHAAEFARNGDRAHPEHNPANRGLDELRWQVDPTDPEANRLVVRYRNFKSSEAAKIEIG